MTFRNFHLPAQFIIPLGLLIAVAICLFLYWPGLTGPMLLDDGPQLGVFFNPESPGTIRSWDYLFSQGGTLGRPVSMFTFILNYELTGQDLFNWKLTNLVIHALIGILVYFLARRLILDSRTVNTEQAAGYWALLLAAVWLLHPLQVSTVLYLVQRMSQLAALFVIAGLLCYVIARHRQIAGAGGHGLLWLSIVLFLPLAAFSKENGVLLLLLIPLAEIFIYKLKAPAEQKRQLVFFLAAGIALPLVLASVYLALNFERFVLGGYEARPYDLIERLLTQVRVLVLYSTQIMMPNPNWMTFFYDDYELSRSIIKPLSTLGALIAIVLVLVASWLYRNKLPLLALGLWFFFIAHLLESSIFPLEMIFEHRNYLPSFGMILGFVAILVHVLPQDWWRYAASGFILAILSVNLAVRAQTWSSEANLYSFMYEQRPESARVASAVAELFASHGHYDEAIKVLQGRSDNGAILQKLYIKCLRDDHLNDDELEAALNRISSPIDFYAVTGVIELSNMGLDSVCDFDVRRYTRFLEDLNNQYSMSSLNQYNINMYRAHFYWHLEEHEKAIYTLSTLFDDFQRSAVPMYLAAEWALALNRPGQAVEYYTRANQRAQESWSSYQGMDAATRNLIDGYISQ